MLNMKFNSAASTALLALSFLCAAKAHPAQLDGHVASAAQGYVSPITIVSDKILYSLQSNGCYTKYETIRMRINDASAIQSASQAELIYTDGRESIQVLNAYTTTPAGKRIPVPKDKIFDQQLPMSANAPMFGDIKVKSIVFPSVEVGSVLSYRYKKIVTRPLFAGEFAMFDSFPKTVAITSSSISVTAPADMTLYIETQGPIRGGAVASTGLGSKTWVWTVGNLSAVRPEAGAVAPASFSPYVIVSSFRDYQAVAKVYAGPAMKAAVVTPKVQALADQITQGTSGKRAQAMAIYNWVSKHIRYVAIYFGLGGVVPHNADAIIANGYGDCKDHVTLLQALLAAKGIQSSPVLINAGTLFWLPKTALSTDIFDHVITYLPEFKLFLDSTAGQAPFGLLPPQEYGKQAVVINAGRGAPLVMTLPATTPQTDQANSTTTAILAANGTVSGNVTYNDTGMFQVLDRSILATLPEGMQTQVAGRLIAVMGVQGTGTISYNDPRDLAKPLNYTATFTLPGYVNLPGSGAFAMPVGVPGLSGFDIGLAQVIALTNRSMPFMCPSNTRSETVDLTLPIGFKGKLPAAVKFSNAMGSYVSSYTQNGEVITLGRTLTLTTPGVCQPAQYPLLKALYSKAVHDLPSQVVY